MILFLYISSKGVESTSEIRLVIQGDGEQNVLNGSFGIEPTKVFVNDVEQNCKKSCTLQSGNNNIRLLFEDEISSTENMFYGIINMLEADLSDFDASKVTRMTSMFEECFSVKKITFGEFNTSSVVDMSNLFHQCKELTSLDVSHFDTTLHIFIWVVRS